MTYTTTRALIDTQDSRRYYREGEVFPRVGLKVSQKRLDELEDKGYIVQHPPDLVLAEDLNRLKKDELVKLATKNEVELTGKETKAEIIEKLEE